jgi:RNA polymerase sigma-70 factor, ECF subfamily
MRVRNDSRPRSKSFGVDDSPAALLGRVAVGDADALGLLYDLLAEAAYGLALVIVDDPAVAEDVVEDSFLRIRRLADRFRPELDEPAAWALAIVHACAVDAVRASRSRPAQDRDGSAALPGRRVLRRIPVEHRRAVLLAYCHGLTLGDIADELGVSRQAAAEQLTAGLRALSAPARSARSLVSDDMNTNRKRDGNEP